MILTLHLSKKYKKLMLKTSNNLIRFSDCENISSQNFSNKMSSIVPQLGFQFALTSLFIPNGSCLYSKYQKLSQHWKEKVMCN